MLTLKNVEGKIEVTASGEIEVAPDEAIIKLDIITEAKTATAAVQANAKRAQSVIDAVAQEPNHGVTTSGLAVGPIYKFDPETNTSMIIGFRATNSIKIMTKPGYAGQIFDAGIRAGANQSSGISFRLQNESFYREEALRMAVKNAFAEARVVANTADVKLDGPRSIEIDPSYAPILFRAEQFSADAASTPVIPEDVMIRANVRMVFQTRIS